MFELHMLYSCVPWLQQRYKKLLSANLERDKRKEVNRLTVLENDFAPLLQADTPNEVLKKLYR